MTTKIFNRRDAVVQTDARDLSLIDFQSKYADATTDVVLRTVWNDAQKKKGGDAAMAVKTDAAVDLPTPAKLETVSEHVSKDDKVKVTVKKDKNKGTTVVETEDTSVETKVNKKGKEVEVKAAPAATPDGKPARATRLRELIAEGKDKTASVAALKAEGYDVKTIHSEWHRLAK